MNYKTLCLFFLFACINIYTKANMPREIFPKNSIKPVQGFKTKSKDYKIQATNNFVYGSAPNTYDQNNKNTLVPARHSASNNFYLGTGYNTSNGKVVKDRGLNNTDQKYGITGVLPTVSKKLNEPGATYSVDVKVYRKNADDYLTLHGWVDFDGNGYFSEEEYVSTNIESSNGYTTVKLTWKKPFYIDSGKSKTYLRLRLTSDAFIKNNEGIYNKTDVRAIGDGTDDGIYVENEPYLDGEVEDYEVPFTSEFLVLKDKLSTTDSDGDGIPDYEDWDSDNDGIPNSIEGEIGFKDTNFNLYCPFYSEDWDSRRWYIYVKGESGTKVTYKTKGSSVPVEKTIPSNNLLIIELTNVDDLPLRQGGKNEYIPLHSDRPVYVMQEVRADANYAQDLSIVLPKFAWGNKYTYLSYDDNTNHQSFGIGQLREENFYTGITIISSEDNNIVNVGGPYPQQYTLAKDESMLISDYPSNLNGIKIESTKSIAVVMGSYCSINPDSTCDNTFEYLLPDNYLGTKFLSTNNTNSTLNLFAATKDNTVIKVNGITQNILNAGEYFSYEQGSKTNDIIETNLPVQSLKVNPYRNADPSVSKLMDINKATVQETRLYIPEIMTNYNDLNIYVKSDNTSKILVNGAKVTGWKKFDYDSNFSYAHLSVKGGTFQTISSIDDHTPYITEWVGVGKDVSESTVLTIGGYDLATGALSESSVKDTDNDGTPDYLDLDSDNDSCLDALEGGDNIHNSQLVDAGGKLTVGKGSTAKNKNLCNNSNCVDSHGIPLIVNPGGAADVDGLNGQTVGTSIDPNIKAKACIFCYKPPVTSGTTLSTAVGISGLFGAKADKRPWPTKLKGASLALESKEKGLVVNRVEKTSDLSKIINPIEGMIIYDKEAKCLKVYTIKDGDKDLKWNCINDQTCPN